MSQGTRVIYITGNHDETLRRYCDIEVGNFQLTDKLVMEINNKMTWIFTVMCLIILQEEVLRYWLNWEARVMAS
jgi:UDP-2,3-diacylglucosamine pyrophosphatase LpxH